MDERALFGAWREGDRQAGQTLIERYYDAIVRFFRTKAGPNMDDLVQRTFLAWSEARERYRGEASVRSFLFGIARNVLLEHIRRKARDRRIDPDFSVGSVREFDPGVSTVALRRSEHRLLVSALQSIPLDMQMTLELYYWEELSVTELAEVLDIPSGTVKSRLHRGRTLLKDAMEAAPASAEDRESVRDLLQNWASDIRGQVPAFAPAE